MHVNLNDVLARLAHQLRLPLPDQRQRAHDERRPAMRLLCRGPVRHDEREGLDSLQWVDDY
ncbi:hypothetical protein BC938DRAFT_476814 [Jimgerdemannia flammicorona]|uniref:Uncharacterized protein n=1 Tax=Jimgerdemannia flammicorona TaxID=994334 RepID=A0A433PE83_9FUNG|nr:hypothetical protein BC938DRAFT_476814 [Jimgerdemannia flammicorona]